LRVNSGRPRAAIFFFVRDTSLLDLTIICFFDAF
jgi:hypothetical protein